MLPDDLVSYCILVRTCLHTRDVFFQHIESPIPNALPYREYYFFFQGFKSMAPRSWEAGGGHVWQQGCCETTLSPMYLSTCQLRQDSNACHSFWIPRSFHDEVSSFNFSRWLFAMSTGPTWNVNSSDVTILEPSCIDAK